MDFEGVKILEQAQDHLLLSGVFLVHLTVLGNGKPLVTHAFSTKIAKLWTNGQTNV